MRNDCLIEIGCEELPPKALQKLSQSLGDLIVKDLQRDGLSPASVELFATPRRLAVLLRDIPLLQPDQLIDKRGPALEAAYDKEGNPSKAALGFARSCGVELDQLEQRESEKGSWLYFSKNEPGKQLSSLLPGVLVDALSNLPIPKRMRWGDRDDEFVRPVKWLVMMIGDEVIDATILGVKSSNLTYGHRFHAPQSIALKQAGDYEQALLDKGMIIPGFDQRRKRIVDLVEQAAAAIPATAAIEPTLLDEVTALVEYPVAITGEFDADFLKVPHEALVMTMRDNQKYFPIFVDDQLQPRFIAISNIESHNPAVVAEGNQRVIRPRFADARFFFEQDKKQSLDAMRTRLDSVVFQKKLGSLGDKTARVVRLAKYIAAQTGAEQDLVRRAAELCKADLMSDMVGEFPKLQGVMGRYYALHQKEDKLVCDAIEQHYWPRFAGDKLPENDVAQCIALADRLDSLVGIFAIGLAPSGDKDPFALRRAALAVVRILIEKKLSLGIVDLFNAALDGYFNKLESTESLSKLTPFIFERLRGYYQDQGIRFDVVDSVCCNMPENLFDCHQRIKAVNEFQNNEAASALAAANKRISNILKKQELVENQTVNQELLSEAAEKSLFAQLQSMQADVTRLFSSGEYLQGLTRLAELRPAVDQFFDDVMVMADDPAVKNNRLALLAELMQSFRQVADFSRLQS
ncbi:MAG: glycyl-tRNA synthetase beta chain [Gammaproteobacteria bacterium]|jgi:glycyl-tRNA synthetase beta chain